MWYKPSIKSLFGSLVWDFSIALLAALMTFFAYESHPRIVLVLDIIAGMMVFVLLIQTIYVHCNKIYIDNRCVMTSSPLCTIRIQWEEVTSALLRERRNAMSRIDHLLVLQGGNSLICYNTSTLDPRDEEALLNNVRLMVRLDVKEDKPSV